MGYYKKPYPSSDPNKPRKQWNPNWGKKKATIVPGSQYKDIATPSAEQIAINNEIVSGNDSIIVSAYAGTGKTSLCAWAQHNVAKLYPNKSQSYIIFARRNSEEATLKCDPSVQVSTAHAAALRCLGKARGKITVDKEKTDRIAMALVGADVEKQELRFWLTKSIDLCKDYMASTVDDVIAVMSKHGLDSCDISEEEFASKTLAGMKVSLEQPNIVSFSDMLYCTLMLNVAVPKSDLVYVDEAQDMNMSRIQFVMRMMGPHSRMVIVGDDKQSLFQWSGADRFSLQKLKEKTNAIEFPLHRTFRCGRKIVESVQDFVPDYIADESCVDGEVLNVSNEFMMSDEGAQPGCFILSRTNAPLTKVAMQLLKMGRKCNIQGRDISQGLLWMIKRSNTHSVPEFQSWLDDWKTAECDRLALKNRDAEHIIDKAECLENFCEGESLLEVVKAKIKAMFDDADGETDRVILSTIHRAKGLERDSVFLLEKSFVIRPRTEEDVHSEKCVRYVAKTRARKSLYLVE